MARLLALVYGVICYLVFLGTFLYAIWFVWTMDAPHAPPASLGAALLIDAGLLALFALQHSVMARLGFKRIWTKIVPRPIERSTYVLAASLALLAVIVFWQPIPGALWSIQAPAAQMLLHVLFFAGFGMVLVGTFLINHSDLFGLQQVWTYWLQKSYEPPIFATPGPYRTVRHPIYLGFIVAFWSTPRMSYAHLFFAVMTTAYILVAIQLEERDLVTFHGEAYRIYRSGVSMLVPWPRKKSMAVGKPS